MKQQGLRVKSHAQVGAEYWNGSDTRNNQGVISGTNDYYGSFKRIQIHFLVVDYHVHIVTIYQKQLSISTIGRTPMYGYQEKRMSWYA